MASTGEVWKLGHRPALDGLRGIAVLMVLLTHQGVLAYFGQPIARLPLDGGNAGVTMFFTLSGFLITTLLLEERARRGRVDVVAFYRRRALRLLPAMLCCVALAVAAELLVLGYVNDWPLVLGTLTYTSNFVMIDGTFPYPTGLGHTWSLGVEEQFYLLWPFALMILARLAKRRVLIVLTYVVLGAFVLRLAFAALGADWARWYFGLDVRADSLMIGCGLALALHGSRPRKVSPWVGLIGAALVALVARAAAVSPVGETSLHIPLVVGVATAGIIYAAVHDGARWLEHPVLVAVGRRSYGLYVYQGPVAMVILETRGPAWLPLGVVAVAVLAELSWRFVEQPFLRRKERRARIVPAWGQGSARTVITAGPAMPPVGPPA